MPRTSPRFSAALDRVPWNRLMPMQPRPRAETRRPSPACPSMQAGIGAVVPRLQCSGLADRYARIGRA